MMLSLGWDIGGVNIKVACVANGDIIGAGARPFELQRAPHRLAEVLRSMKAEMLAAGVFRLKPEATSDRDDQRPAAARHAVTMTAELSQMFRSKREGVSFVLDAIDAAFPDAAIHVFRVDGHFMSSSAARNDALAVAAANWSATAHVVAERHPDALLIDVGTTTTDIIPIVSRRVLAAGRTDPERLSSGELVYTGAVRTPVEAIVNRVTLGESTAAVSAEGFALAGDVHLWRGALSPSDYTAPTPDGRPPTREFAAERLARVVCADREMLDGHDVSRIADDVAAAQVRQVVDGIERVRTRHPRLQVAVVTGLGAFIAAAAAQAAGLQVVELAIDLGAPAARHAPAAAVALLLDRVPSEATATETDVRPARRGVPADGDSGGRTSGIDLVVKVGGALMAHPPTLDGVLGAVTDAARQQRLLVVPGGGAFADGIRDADRRLEIGDDAAHWMAILAMDQFAHVLVSRMRGAVLVRTASEVEAALQERGIPVLAPSRWLQDADPLPHSWDVTSDSIAAWVADAVASPRLVLIKPPGARGDLVDRYFPFSSPLAHRTAVVVADSLEAVTAVLWRSPDEVDTPRDMGSDPVGELP